MTIRYTNSTGPISTENSIFVKFRGSVIAFRKALALQSGFSPVAFVKGRIARRRSRQQLLRLDDAMLKDIGLTKEQAIEESKKSFWI